MKFLDVTPAVATIFTRHWRVLVAVIVIFQPVSLVNDENTLKLK